MFTQAKVKEFEAFEIIKNHLHHKEGSLIEEEKYEPNGIKTFPDFSAMIDNKQVYLEISHNQLREDDNNDIKRIKQLNQLISAWVPNEYTLLINVSKFIIGRRGGHFLAHKLSNYLKKCFQAGRLYLSREDFSSFINEIAIDSARFLTYNETFIFKFPYYSLSGISQHRVFFINRIQVKNGPEDPEHLRSLIEKKELKRTKELRSIVNDTTIAMWLIITSGTGFDRSSYREAIKRLRAIDSHIKKGFERIFIIFKEIDVPTVLEL